MYKKGSDNTVADVFSRRDTEELQLAVSSSLPQWLSDIANSYSDSPLAQELLSKLVVNPDALPHYSLSNGVICYKGRIWLGHSEQLRT